ncbi:hypothetical protein B0F90DRAFT_1918874 [Multifurca ochricompacta]|uniref:Uncharacterized protein n=1 Tax=Multifurca ochricompacta TaxID=376703 RepID=A0AAD4QLM9_9AGAM|nr:hypothetical protein B0F90DRAFT_1918874 [Multifurca ochricompacta]
MGIVSYTKFSRRYEGANTTIFFLLFPAVNQVLKTQIAQIHAFTQKTLTPQQWEDAQKAETPTTDYTYRCAAHAYVEEEEEEEGEEEAKRREEKRN